MKKILLSLAVILVVGGVVWGVTGAFYNDSETSSGNIFVAGSIDLKVDHLKQTYNGDDCETCSLTLYSGDGGAQVVAGNNTVITVFPYAAPLVTPTPITTQYWTTHSTAQWIWASPATLVGDDGTLGDVTYTFEHDFNWWGAAVDVDLLFDVAADNQYQILLNGNPIASGLGSAEYTTLDVVAEGAFLAQVQPGQNTLTFIVTNKVNTPGNNNPLNNPGGLLYYLTVTRDQEDCDANSAFQQACRLWYEKDLVEGDTFFNFGDIKPSDWGTNLISFHVSTNDAYACLFPTGMVDAENTRIEPEQTAGDPTDGTIADGELSQFIKMFGWADDGDGVYEGGETVVIPVNTPFNQIGSSTIAMNLQSENTDYVGLAWCVGTQSLSGDNVLCSGNASGIDQAQTDSVVASLTAYAVQQRNNENFSCANVVLPPPVSPNQ